MYRAHPKAYVGMFKHSMHPDKDDKDLAFSEGPTEYRSDDFWYIPGPGDVTDGSIIGTYFALQNCSLLM
jgi:hypothetical protein